MSRGAVFAVALTIVSLASISPAAAHEGGTTGYATVAVDGAAARYSLTLWPRTLPSGPAGELARVQAGDPGLTARWVTLLRDHVRVSGNGIACTAGEGRLDSSRAPSQSITLVLAFTCAAPVRELVIRDDMFDVLGADHHTLVRVDAAGHTRQVALTPDAREARLAVGTEDGTGVLGFIALGLEHILTGYDHLLFLAALLLGGGGALMLLKTVTAFTAGHSLSLAAAVLGLVAVPAWLVESVIAGSIAWVAIENVLHHDPPRRRWLTSLGFGLVHGLGFASALAPLDLPGWGLAGALFGFNIGVEAGQALVIALIAPAIVWLGGWNTGRRVRRLLSVTVAAAGCAWLAIRVFSA